MPKTCIRKSWCKDCFL